MATRKVLPEDRVRPGQYVSMFFQGVFILGFLILFSLWTQVGWIIPFAFILTAVCEVGGYFIYLYRNRDKRYFNELSAECNHCPKL